MVGTGLFVTVFVTTDLVPLGSLIEAWVMTCSLEEVWGLTGSLTETSFDFDWSLLSGILMFFGALSALFL